MVALAVTLIALLLVGRGVLEGRASLRKCDESLAKNDVEGAIAYGMYAAKWYVPFAPHVRQGYDRLRTIALRAELAGDTETALVAWQAVRAAALGSQSVWIPFDDRRHEADDHIAALLGSEPPPTVENKRTKEQRIADHRALLAAEVRPKTLAVVALYAGLLAWAIGAVTVGRALDDDPKRAPPSGGRGRALGTGLVLAIAGIVAFFVALGNA